MALANIWMLVAAGAVIIAAILAGLLIGRRQRAAAASAAAQVSRAERMRDLISFRSAVRRRRTALAGIVALALLAVAAAGLVAARPMSSKTVQPINSSRDIMLCLDVSGSMSDVDIEVIEVFDDLLEGFQGERIGLVIFNSSPVQVFPLTDDYGFVREHLLSIRDSFDYVDELPEHWTGTLNGPGASLIGDGLASCAMGFDHPDDDRSRSIILATDNEVNGASIIELPEAAAYAKAQGVRVFALNPVQGDTDVSRELVDAVASTGGQAYGLRDTTTVADVIEAVEEEDATELRGQAQVVWTDAPNTVIAVLLAVVLGLVALVWRVRL